MTAGVLRADKGPNGGCYLARPAAEITLPEVVEAVDGPVRGQAPEIEGENVSPRRKPGAVCDEVASLVRARLAAVSVAELAGGRAKRGRGKVAAGG